jgi:hypothetical protein
MVARMSTPMAYRMVKLDIKEVWPEMNEIVS